LNFDFNALSEFSLEMLLPSNTSEMLFILHFFKLYFYLSRPLTIIASSSQRAAVSSIEWEVRRTEAPVFITLKITLHNWRLAPGSRPQDGSSMIVTRG